MTHMIFLVLHINVGKGNNVCDITIMSISHRILCFSPCNDVKMPLVYVKTSKVLSAKLTMILVVFQGVSRIAVVCRSRENLGTPEGRNIATYVSCDAMWECTSMHEGGVVIITCDTVVGGWRKCPKIVQEASTTTDIGLLLVFVTTCRYFSIPV